ncbi:MAG: tetratricopeptide repeat protein [Gammaproteobacteria bacterium]
MKRFLILSLLTFLLTVAGTANAEMGREVRQAQKLLADGDYEQALKEYMRVAEEKNNPLAKHAIAMFYDFGWGRTPDPVKACEWHEQAAKGEIPAAAEALARCYAEGIGRDVDYAQAAAWYQKAADLGIHSSLCSLGALYITGQGVEKDPAKGLSLCQQSAEQGSVPAMLRLARFYMHEAEVRNYEAALHWYSNAASYQSVEAEYQLGVMLRDGLGINRDPMVARSWFELAASKGYEPACFETAALYINAPVNPETGLWHEDDLARAYLWLSITLKRTQDAEQRKLASEMMDKVLEFMPKTWNAALDEKVDAYLKQFPAAAVETK